MQKVLIPEKFKDTLEPELNKNNLQPICLTDQSASTILKEADDVSGIILSSDKVDKSLMEKLPNLKVVARTGVGYDNVDIDGAKQLNIPVTNTPGANAHAVAENTVTDLLILSKHVYSTANQMRGMQAISDYPRHLLYGKTVGVVGFGNTAQQVIKLLSSFGVKILIWNRHQRTSEYGKFVDWDTLIKQSDYITLHVPATPQTTDIINVNTFKTMKNSAFIVNFGRGELINQNDLINALQNDEIAGAGLDVFDQEPLPKDSPLRKVKNLFLTPHVGLNSEESNQKVALVAANNVIQALNGEDPSNRVN